jgi:hypothetical protein
VFYTSSGERIEVNCTFIFARDIISAKRKKKNYHSKYMHAMEILLFSIK